MCPYNGEVCAISTYAHRRGKGAYGVYRLYDNTLVRLISPEHMAEPSRDAQADREVDEEVVKRPGGSQAQFSSSVVSQQAAQPVGLAPLPQTDIGRDSTPEGKVTVALGRKACKLSENLVIWMSSLYPASA